MCVPQLIIGSEVDDGSAARVGLERSSIKYSTVFCAVQQSTHVDHPCQNSASHTIIEIAASISADVHSRSKVQKKKGNHAR